eukprot:362768-Chlamydomonas_euryale.AAC.2
MQACSCKKHPHNLRNQLRSCSDPPELRLSRTEAPPEKNEASLAVPHPVPLPGQGICDALWPLTVPRRDAAQTSSGVAQQSATTASGPLEMQ